METLEPRRLLSSPELDLTFAEGGVAAASGADGTALVVKEIVGGKLFAGGYGNDFEPVVARFNKDGSLDQSFDGDGKLELPQKEYGQVKSAAFANSSKGNLFVLETSVADVVTIERQSGNDSLVGGEGNDVIEAGGGRDYLAGGGGKDELHRDAGMNTLRGGAGNDVLYTGNAEVDHYR